MASSKEHQDSSTSQHGRGRGRGGRGGRGRGRGRGRGNRFRPSNDRDAAVDAINTSTPERAAEKRTQEFLRYSSGQIAGVIPPPALPAPIPVEHTTPSANVLPINWRREQVNKDNYKQVPLYDPDGAPPTEAQREAGFQAMLAGEEGLDDGLLRRVKKPKVEAKDAVPRVFGKEGKLIDVDGNDSSRENESQKESDTFELMPSFKDALPDK